MKRPGKLIAASKISEVFDVPVVLSTRERVLIVLKEAGPLSMNKTSILSGVIPRTVRYLLAELMAMNIIVKSECTQCGSHMTYKIA